MSLNGFAKAGWFLVGLGVGVMGTTIIFKRELEKPIGEFEEYIPLEDREGFDSDRKDCQNNTKNYRSGEKDISSDRESRRDGSEHRNGRRSSRYNDREEESAEFSSNKDDVINYYRSSDKDATRQESRSREDKRRKEFEERRGRGPGQQSTRYSKMYQDEDVEEALHAANSGRESRESFKNWNQRTETYYSDDVMSVHDDDFPEDDYVVSQVVDSDPHDEYVMERVEENIEVYLDDNPQDFETMIFYEGDNTLCDDGEQIVPNAEEIIGLAALSRLIEGGPGAENGVIFVHNLKTSLNYEVVLDAGSYQDTVIGQFESRLDRDGGIGGRS